MYCEKCGTKNNKTNKYCSSCGTNLIKEDNSNVKEFDNNKGGILVLAILAIVFSVLVWPVGLVFAIISIAKYKKYKKENYENNAVLILDIISFFICFIGFVISVILVLTFIFTFSLVSKEDDKVFGDYTCYISRYSQKPVVSASFKNKKFSWAKYGDEEDNVLMGTYFTNKREIKNGTQTYGLILKPNYYEADNKIKIKNRYNITITTNGTDKANISFENGSTYYCDKIGD